MTMIQIPKMSDIKHPIIGDISLRRKVKESTEIDYNIPSIFRKKGRV